MKTAEFYEWLEYHKSTFPQVAEWLKTVNFKDLLPRWADAFDMAHLQDCKDCTDKMLSGKIDHPSNFDLHMLPAMILKNLPYRAPRTEDLPFLNYNPQTGEITRKKNV
ncbi:hypothetical protein UFOVP1229_62 [uncultured Caudovirales phage]|uniref:Uncharacterized protein n=1 Tax=uncultured Caudovirales phage TaxID=2100421 RepID=A0A6J5RIM9_9CAUD|nr:hypothetical protein UFOVP1229_62 [uncultured Caudovirales phage]